MTRAEQIRARRKITQRVGLAAIVMMTATLTACVFDQGDGYQGGGRKNNGGTVTTATTTATATATDTTTAPTSTSDDSGVQLPGLDAADADAG